MSKTHEIDPSIDRVVREPERLHITGVPYPTWRKYEKLGEAPMGQQLFGNTKGWRLSDLTAWVDERFPPEEAAA